MQLMNQIDGAPEEKARGITINTAHVDMKQTTVTMHTLTVQDTLIYVKT